MLKLTTEQNEILEIDLNKYSIILIQALAGTGKTTTLLEIIKKHPELEFIYLAFNNKIIEEIKSKTKSKQVFPNVEASTIHSFALKYTKGFFEAQGKTLENNLTFDHVQEILGGIKPFEIYSTIRWFNIYCNQELEFKEYKQFIKKLSNKEKFDLQIHERKDYILSILNKVETLYKTISEGESTFFTHNVYLKYFIDHMEDYSYDNIDVLLVDEAQDLNPVMFKLVLTFIKKGKKFIGVGDDNQSIYGFLNNINLLIELQKDFQEHPVLVKTLTNSFRFSANSLMEKLANLILNYRGVSINGASNNTDETLNDVILLGRSNAQVFWNAYELSVAKKAFMLIGGIDKQVQEFFEDVNHIISNDSHKVKSKLLKEFHNTNELKLFAQKENDQEIMSALTLLKKLEDEKIKLFDFFKNIKKFNKNIHYIKARPEPTYLSTIHKAKGLEFDEVEMIPKLSDRILPIGFKYNTTIGNGFMLLKLLPARQITEELNLLYVAVTRAKKELTINNEETLLNIQFLRSKMKFKNVIEISDYDLEKANSQFEYLSSEFYEVVFDSWKFYINKEELEALEKVLKNEKVK